MRKFNQAKPYGTIIPPDGNRLYQQNGSFYDAQHEFIEFDLSTAEGQELAAMGGNQNPVAKPKAAPKAKPVVEEETAIEPTGEAIVADENGLIHVPDESADDLNADGEPASAERDQLAAYLNGEEKLEWFTVQSIAQQEFGERPATKKDLRTMMGM